MGPAHRRVELAAVGWVAKLALTVVLGPRRLVTPAVRSLALPSWRPAPWDWAAVAAVTGGLTLGTVVAVGPGRLLDSGERAAMSVAVGDEVIYGKYGGTDIEVNGEDVKILRESDILAKVIE